MRYFVSNFHRLDRKSGSPPHRVSTGLSKKLFFILHQYLFAVTTKKKNFYEILAIRPDATHEEIQAGYDSLILALKSQQKLFKPEDYELKLKIINMAFNMLSIPASRAAYDAELAASRTARPDAGASNTIALRPDAETMSLKAEALALRAEAISLRVDALSMKSDIGAFNSPENYQGPGPSGAFGLTPSLKKIIMFLGFMLAGWMVLQVISLLFFNRNSSMSAGAAAKAEEKAIIQEYYQTHGVRVKTRAEVELLEAEERRQEKENHAAERDTSKAEREKQRAEENARRFEEEARRRADQVSANLQYSENKAREQAEREEREEAEKKWRQDEEKRASEQAERNRIEREKERWRQTLNR
jgi:curved DNA-binding protein CbpA